MPPTAHRRQQPADRVDASGLNRTESTTQGDWKVLTPYLLDAYSTTLWSGFGSAEPLPRGIVFQGTPREYPLEPPLVSVAKRSFGGQACMAGSWPPLPHPEDPSENRLAWREAPSPERLSEAYDDWCSFVLHPRSRRTAARNRWLEIAREQLHDLDAEAQEEGIEPPSEEARSYAVKFIDEFSKRDLPPPTVFPDNNRSVSIQMGVKQFIFLLTCFEGGRGIYDAIHDTYRMSGSYNDLSVDGIPGSPFLKCLQCLLSPLSDHASLANRTG